MDPAVQALYKLVYYSLIMRVLNLLFASTSAGTNRSYYGSSYTSTKYTEVNRLMYTLNPKRPVRMRVRVRVRYDRMASYDSGQNSVAS